MGCGRGFYDRISPVSMDIFKAGAVDAEAPKFCSTFDSTTGGALDS